MEIVNLCMSNRNDKYRNDNTASWKDGCIISSTASPTSSSGATLSQATSLKIGVGDGSSDSNDWAMFYMFDDNGGGDFGGKNKYDVGGEDYTSDLGMSGNVEIVIKTYI